MSNPNYSKKPYYVIGRTEGGVGGGEAGSVDWANVTNKPQTYPPSEHNHDDRYNTKEDVQGIIDFVTEQMEQERGKVRTFSDDEPDFLKNKVDAVTVGVRGSEVFVKSIDGLNLGVADLNTALEGTEGNIQTQIDDINDLLASVTAGMRFIGKFESFAELNGIVNKSNGDLAVVLTDETRDDTRSMYVYSEDKGMWEFIGAFTFSDEFTALKDTPTSYAGADGKVVKVAGERLVFDDVDYANLANKPSSTITQIDDAVAKRHEHGNKVTLDRIGIIEQEGEKILTIDGIPYEPKREKKEIFSAYLSSSSITVEANNYIKWDTVKPLSNIPYDPNTGLFKLTPGRSYKVIVSVMGEISSYITVHFARGAEKVRSNPYGTVYGATTVTNRGGSGVLATTFTIGESSAGLYGILVGEIGGKESVRLFNNRTMIMVEEIEI